MAAPGLAKLPCLNRGELKLELFQGCRYVTNGGKRGPWKNVPCYSLIRKKKKNRISCTGVSTTCMEWGYPNLPVAGLEWRKHRLRLMRAL